MTSNIIQILSSVRSFRLIENDKCGNTIVNCLQGSTHFINNKPITRIFVIIFHLTFFFGGFSFLGNLCDWFIGFFLCIILLENARENGMNVLMELYDNN